MGGVAECTGGIGFRSSRIWAMAMGMGVAGMAIIGVENGCGKLGQYMKEI